MGDPPETPGSPKTAGTGECPICRTLFSWDEKSRFWFLQENHSFPETLDPLTRSLGFCFFHGAHASDDPSGGSPLALVHEVLCRRIEAILSRQRPGRAGRNPIRFTLAAPAPCPACRDRDDAVRRAISSLLPEIGSTGPDPRALEETVCLPHMRLLIPRMPPPLRLRLLSRLTARLESAMDGVQRDGSERDRLLHSALLLAAGSEGIARLYPPREGVSSRRTSGIRSPGFWGNCPPGRNAPSAGKCGGPGPSGSDGSRRTGPGRRIFAIFSRPAPSISTRSSANPARILRHTPSTTPLRLPATGSARASSRLRCRPGRGRPGIRFGACSGARGTDRTFAVRSGTLPPARFATGSVSQEIVP